LKKRRGAGHYPQHEAPIYVAAAMNGFLSRQCQPEGD
jgi:hypothetical protein